MNRATETRLRKLETVIDPKDKPALLIIAYDEPEAHRKLVEAREAGLAGEPTIVITGVPNPAYNTIGAMLQRVAQHGRKIYDPRPT
jgi:hypothetical protein